ncbi:RNA-guided pseudouridylation complex pseudouridine synthase subunit Cbf5 [Halorhabdus sp. CUG00001]|uniref:RNA-guided pseudouridylation complex pseudouridine synthase subunit Cbf5 n=1 Tax=Halorhabdus sp. CUG00001 TaxID=2600297 RepID=UPI00131BFF25|nr:RNA-guided pseudouridylation complex pseudouridine synthase subunit Cbf5 [Halorhabdus sp. CUG00001]
MTLRGPPEERSPAALLQFGVVNLDKPPGPSAHQVAAWMRDLADVERAAHAGTLDPKVTGCLPMLVGDATRIAQVFDDSVKEYVAVLELHDRVQAADLARVATEFEGEIYQKPPKKSAVVRRLRSREILDLDVLEQQDRQALLRVRCASGTYIRKLCHDIGLALGTGAHMGDLRRVGTEPFDDSELVTLHDVTDALSWWRDNGDPEPLRDVVQPAERALVDLPAVTIAESAAASVAEGASVYAPGVIDADDGLDPAAEPLVACYTPNGAAVCLGRLVGEPTANAGPVVDLERVLV